MGLGGLESKGLGLGLDNRTVSKIFDIGRDSLVDGFLFWVWKEMTKKKYTLEMKTVKVRKSYGLV